MKEVLDLQIFAEGGVASAGDGVGAAAATAAEGSESPQTPVFKSSRRGAKANPFANVVFGKQEGAAAQKAAGAPKAETATEAPKVTDRKAEFDKLIQGDYKDLFEQKLADARKQGEDSQRGDADRYRQMSSVLEILGRKHGITPDAEGNYDLSKLSTAVQAEDDNYWNELAMRTGKDAKELKDAHYRTQRMMALEKENAALRAEEQRRKGEEQARKTFAGWMEQAEKAKTVYPSLDLHQELKGNPQFGELLRAGIDVKTAFEVIHKDEIMPAAMQYAAKTVEQSMANKIAAQAARPSENGSASGSVTVKTDVSKLTKAERKEIARRARNGERIVF